MGGWGCPHEDRGVCLRVDGKPCDPGMKGCILFGRFTFSKDEKNSPSVQRRLRAEEAKDKKS